MSKITLSKEQIYAARCRLHAGWMFAKDIDTFCDQALAAIDLQSQVEAHETIRDLCFQALPDCPLWGDIPGEIAELKNRLARIYGSGDCNAYFP